MKLKLLAFASGLAALVVMWMYMPPSGLRLLLAAIVGAVVMHVIETGTE